MASRTEFNGTTKLVHFLDLNTLGFEKVKEGQRPAARNSITSFLRNQTLRQLSNGESPVAGEGRFPILTEEYAKKQKGGVRTSNLELFGDLKDSLIVEPIGDSFIKFGHEGSQVPKSDGHNQISSKAKSWARKVGFKKRRYIPDNGQTFDNSINIGIKEIITSHIVDEELEPEEFEGDIFSQDITVRPATTATTTPASQGGLFSDDVIDSLLQDALNNRV